MPPKVSRPALVDESFERSFRDKLHNQLVLRNRSSTVKLSETEAKGVRQASPAQLSSMVDDARVALGARELATTPHNYDEFIVQGTKQKRRILQEYKEKIGANYSDSIITKKKGKHSYTNPDRKIICI